MIDYNKEASVFFGKNTLSREDEFVSNKLPCATLAFFPAKLESFEEEKIRTIFDASASKSDVKRLIDLTVQIKAIQKQGIILLGEKIFKAREIIRKNSSKRTSFSSWINISFKTKSSAYNALAYYELYSKLSTEVLKKSFINIPYKAAYKLSSKNINIEDKEKMIPYLSGLSNSEAMSIIGNFPCVKDDVISTDCNNCSTLFRSVKSRLFSVLKDVVNCKLIDQSQRKEIWDIIDLIKRELSN